MFSPAAYLTELYRQAKVLYPEQNPWHIDKRRPDFALPPGETAIPEAGRHRHQDHRRGRQRAAGDQQVVVDYVAAGPYQGVVPDSKLRRLPKTAALLRAGKPLRVTVLGDSISTGANASGATGAAPWQPP